MKPDQTKHTFRPDINGLRAWAVISVVLFHFEIPGFSGGFVGVDVFFVISGFLMAGIVTKGLEQKDFSLIDFYLSRALRIWPALVAVCLALLWMGWMLLLPSDYKKLSSHIAYSISFVSNIEYWLESGYFDAASHEKWLLHTWSLSVEWQFYLLLPVVLLTTWRIKSGRAAQISVMIAVLIASFAASILTTQIDPDGAFFLLHTRAWEMIVGGLVFYATPFLQPQAKTRFWIEKAGLLLITSSVAIFSTDTKWPGFLATLPVLGAALVIIAKHESRLTGCTLAQWIGERSYSIYLWHWPICVALTHFDIRNDYRAIAIGLLGSTALGHLSYVLVESRIRKKGHTKSSKSVIFGLSVACGGAGVLAVLVWALNGVSGRFDPAIEIAAAEAQNINPRRGECHPNKGPVSPSCHHGRGERKIVLIGDSHANSMVTALSAAGLERGFSVIEWTYSACNFVPGIKKTKEELEKFHKDYQCSEFIYWVQSQLKELPKDVPIVIANRYAAEAFGANEAKKYREKPGVYFSKQHNTADTEFIQEFSNHISNSACQIAKDRKVFMVRPLPEMGFDVPRKLSRQMIFGISQDLYIPLDDYKKRNDWAWAAQNKAREQCGIKIIDPTSILCQKERCYGSMRGRPLYHDDDHLSGFGNQLVTPVFLDIFSSI